MEQDTNLASIQKSSGHGGRREGAGRKLGSKTIRIPDKFLAEPFDCDGEPRVDSRILAVDWDIKHQSLRELAETYHSELESFGHVRFETGDGGNRPQGGGMAERYLLLNESQALFLLTVSRPNIRTVALRTELVRRFIAYRERLRQAGTQMQITGSELREMGREMTAALMPIVDRLAIQVGGVDTKVVQLEAGLQRTDAKVDAIGADVAAINEKVSRLRPPRSDFSKGNKERFRRTVRYRYRGCCPCCEAVLIVDDEAAPLGNLHYDHWTDASDRNRVEEGWAVCAGCNAGFLGERGRTLRIDLEPAFLNFQRKRREFERATSNGEQIPIQFA